jgi:HEPN domain-containing protein
MDETKRQHVQAWLIKAQRDLATAHKLAADPTPLLDTAIYHCQQAAEKVVKGYLVFHDRRFTKTHDIRVLVDLATPIEPMFGDWLLTAERLTPYVAIFRYPDDASSVFEPDRAEFDQALGAAQQLYTFVLSLLPSETHPSA